MAGKSKAGRKPKIQIMPEIMDEICKNIEAGLPKRLAVAGLIDESTLYDYINRGDEDIAKGKTTIYSEFAKRVKESEKRFCLGKLQKIERASEETWTAAAWLLERRFPDEFGRNRLEITGKDGEPVQTESTVKIYLPDNGRDKKGG